MTLSQECDTVVSENANAFCWIHTIRPYRPGSLSQLGHLSTGRASHLHRMRYLLLRCHAPWLWVSISRFL